MSDTMRETRPYLFVTPPARPDALDPARTGPLDRIDLPAGRFQQVRRQLRVLQVQRAAFGARAA